jgi:hypothetical protein
MGVTLVSIVIALAVNLAFYALQQHLEMTWIVTLDEGGA